MKRVFLLLNAGLLLCLASCGSNEEKNEEVGVLTVTTPLQTDTTVLKTYVAQIKAIQHIELRALEKGYLQKIYVDEGQHIKKGQLMFQILPLMYQAEAQKAEAEANFAEIEYRNTKALADSNIVSKNELALAKAKYNKAKAELNIAHVHLGFTEIKAPFNGIMDKFQVRLGSLVDEGDLLTTLSDNSKVWVYFNVPEAEYLAYKQANPDDFPKVHLQLANETIFNNEGTIETIEADFNNETGNIAFRATFPNPQGILRHGQTGNILIPSFYKNAIIIPQAATFDILDKKYVYIVDKNNIIHSREIKIGAELPHLYIVVNGLSKTDKILLDGIRKVKNNMKIEYKTISTGSALKDFQHLFTE